MEEASVAGAEVRSIRFIACSNSSAVLLCTTSRSCERGLIHVVLASGERMTIGEGTSADLQRTVMSLLRPSC
jgi:hypothetical protein